MQESRIAAYVCDQSCENRLYIIVEMNTPDIDNELDGDEVDGII